MTGSNNLLESQPRFFAVIFRPKTQVVFATVSLAVIILFNSFFFFFQPYDGLEVYSEAPLGQIYYVYPNSPASHAGVQIGDQIVTIGGKQFNPLLAEPRYPADIRSGMIIYYQFSRRGAEVILPIRIGSYFENVPLLSSYLGIQFLSIALWVIGLALALFSLLSDISARLLSLCFLIAGMTVAVAGASGWNSLWGANTLQKVLLSLLVPLIIAVHFTFPSVKFSSVEEMAYIFITCSFHISDRYDPPGRPVLNTQWKIVGR